MSVQQSYSTHYEPESQGGLKYFKCEVCGNEALSPENVHLDFEECEGE